MISFGYSDTNNDAFVIFWTHFADHTIFRAFTRAGWVHANIPKRYIQIVHKNKITSNM